ncbi:hypothetical protein LOTGIDRAFT_164847 [Lottia gigantea]|uniref:Uncharacterized protein n=1 Tax=Lottia gigantea TaxID=225164 RepID=V4A493_LOTGI|nr:hypothetical protein LOTGIDRAFT_164847 [Lottia gigantea]ESO89810.1 hypothetical protein LOTGIDRAFT_164847 [Lottia gigantea]
MSGESNRVEDVYGIICGDLGMGEGLKPGGLPHSDKNGFANDLNNSSETALPGLKLEALSCNCTKCEDESLSKTSQPCVHCSYQSPSRKKSKSNGTDCCDHENSRRESQSSAGLTEEFPSYADVPLGTSLRQQKKLFEQNLGTILRNHTNNQPAVLTVSTNSDKCQKDRKSCTRQRRSLSTCEIEKKLVDAVTEVEELKIELETCRRRLDAKYRAIAILKRQAEEAREEVEDNSLMSKEYNSILAKEVNKLSFELQWRESSFMDSQELWAQRFDR